MNDILDRCFLLVLVACKWPSIYNFAFGLEVFAIIFVAPHQLLHTPPPPDLHVIDHVPNHHQPVKAPHGASPICPPAVSFSETHPQCGAAQSTAERLPQNPLTILQVLL